MKTQVKVERLPLSTLNSQKTKKMTSFLSLSLSLSLSPLHVLEALDNQMVTRVPLRALNI